MELPSKISKQKTFVTRPKSEEHMLIVMAKYVHAERLSQSLQTNIKQFKIAVAFLTGFVGTFNVTDKKRDFCFTVRINDDDFSAISIPLGAYEV